MIPDPDMLDVSVGGGDVYFYHKPVFFVWQGNSINLSYVMHTFKEYDELIVVMEDMTRVRFTDPDIIERFMKMMEA